jgi:hypothetical protein
MLDTDSDAPRRGLILDTDRPKPAELVAELGQLVRMGARRPDIVVVEGKPGCNWSFNWHDDIVTVDPDHIRRFAPDFCRGIALHEAAHAAVTRLHDILSKPLLGRLMPLLNTIEDIRIETWMRRRFPGAAPWVRAYNDALYGVVHRQPLQRSRQVQFLRSILELWWLGAAPEGILPEVAAALVTCRQALADAPACQPPLDDDHQKILASQRGMWEIVRARIVPTWDRLVDLDRREGIEALADSEMQQFIGMGPGQSDQGLRRLGETDGGRGTRDAASRISAELRTDGSDGYLAAWGRIAHLADSLGDELMRRLVPRQRLRWTTGHAFGSRVDLRTAMQFEADPRQYRRLWMQPVLPHRCNPAVAVLVDRSGSMQGPRIERSFEGLVLLLEVCHRIGVPAAAWSFARNVNQEIAWDTTLDEPARRRLGTLPARVGDLTLMAPALNAVGTAFAARKADPKILFVLGDGHADEAEHVRQAVSRLENDGVIVIGLGLGEGTDALANLFTRSKTGLPADRIVESVAELLSETLLAEV